MDDKTHEPHPQNSSRPACMGPEKNKHSGIVVAHGKSNCFKGPCVRLRKAYNGGGDIGIPTTAEAMAEMERRRPILNIIERWRARARMVAPIFPDRAVALAECADEIERDLLCPQ